MLAARCAPRAEAAMGDGFPRAVADPKGGTARSRAWLKRNSATSRRQKQKHGKSNIAGREGQSNTSE